jgi:hypothetical protein
MFLARTMTAEERGLSCPRRVLEPLGPHRVVPHDTPRRLVDDLQSLDARTQRRRSERSAPLEDEHAAHLDRFVRRHGRWAQEVPTRPPDDPTQGQRLARACSAAARRYLSSASRIAACAADTLARALATWASSTAMEGSGRWKLHASCVPMISPCSARWSVVRAARRRWSACIRSSRGWASGCAGRRVEGVAPGAGVRYGPYPFAVGRGGADGGDGRRHLRSEPRNCSGSFSPSSTTMIPSSRCQRPVCATASSLHASVLSVRSKICA